MTVFYLSTDRKTPDTKAIYIGKPPIWIGISNNFVGQANIVTGNYFTYSGRRAIAIDQ